MLTTRKTKRTLQLGLLVLHHYQAFRTFQRMSDQERKQHLAIPQHFVQSLLDLGPLFIKLGQILSTRPDVLPKEYITELVLLQEHVPPFPYSDVSAIIRQEFQQDIHDLFRSFEEIAVASASLAQVHFAELSDGTQVAVQPGTSSLRPILDSFARSVLEREYSEDEIDGILDEMWSNYEQFADAVLPKKRLAHVSWCI